LRLLPLSLTLSQSERYSSSSAELFHYLSAVCCARVAAAASARILYNTQQREATQTAETMERARQINNNQSMRETRSRNNSSAPYRFSQNPLSLCSLCVSPVLLGPRKHKTPSPPALNDCWLRLPSSPLLLQWRWFVQLSCRVNY
jgi:hypothetical protein